jgi:hypothetical protein
MLINNQSIKYISIVMENLFSERLKTQCFVGTNLVFCFFLLLEFYFALFSNCISIRVFVLWNRTLILCHNKNYIVTYFPYSKSLEFFLSQNNSIIIIFPNKCLYQWSMSFILISRVTVRVLSRLDKRCRTYTDFVPIS